MHRLPCPCCGFLTLEHAYGSYVVCPICAWEDDGVQLANPTSAGGANERSLAEAQARVIERYPLDIDAVRGFRRDVRWRPLSDAEIAAAEQRRVVDYWHSLGACDLADAYWLKTST